LLIAAFLLVSRPQTPNPACSSSIRKSWGIMEQMGMTQGGRDTLQQRLRLCKVTV
jgi:hypothetical protein